MDVSGQLHSTAVLPMGKGPPIPIILLRTDIVTIESDYGCVQVRELTRPLVIS
jgi:hypothetical protein